MSCIPQVFLHFAIWSHSLSIPKKKFLLFALQRVTAFSPMYWIAFWQFRKCFILVLILSTHHSQLPEHSVNWDPILKQSKPAADFSVSELFVKLFQATPNQATSPLQKTVFVFHLSSSSLQWLPITRPACENTAAPVSLLIFCEELD